MTFTIAILGRPNVGKSTLFNRLVGRKQALVDDTPGVTRDRIEGDARFAGRKFRVIDTAGIETGANDTLDERLRIQTLQGLAEADLGLLLIDARAGITGADEDIAALLRPHAKPIIVLANKAESKVGAAGAHEAWRLGLGEPIAISAEHGDGTVELLDRLRPYLDAAEAAEAAAAEPVDDPEEDDETALKRPLRLAIVGRPNAGKSSLVNRLVGDERMLTGPEPGLTRDSVRVPWTWQGRSVELVDTAGLRRKARIDVSLDKMSASASVQAIRAAHVTMLVVDAATPLEKQDLAIAALAIQEGRPVVIALNKWDLVEDSVATATLVRERIEGKLPQILGVMAVQISALTGRGVDKLLPAVMTVEARWRTKVPTAALNRWLEGMLERHAPPMAQGRRIKMRYMTQTRSRPPTFAFFANKPADALPASYLRYLEKGLRETFGLDGIPLRLEIRHQSNPYDPD